MPKKVTVCAVSAFLLSVAATGFAAAAWFQVWLNAPLEESPELQEVAFPDVAGVVAAEGDVAIDLSSLDQGGNTQLIWRCGKTLVGSRFDYSGAWNRFHGRVLIDSDAQAMRAGELHVAVTAMRGHGESPAPNAMISTVRSNQWFSVDHPTAVLTTKEIISRGRTSRVRPRASRRQPTAMALFSAQPCETRSRPQPWRSPQCPR